MRKQQPMKQMMRRLELRRRQRCGPCGPPRSRREREQLQSKILMPTQQLPHAVRVRRKSRPLLLPKRRRSGRVHKRQPKKLIRFLSKLMWWRRCGLCGPPRSRRKRKCGENERSQSKGKEMLVRSPTRQLRSRCKR